MTRSRSKYRNVCCAALGLSFDSQAERDRYLALRSLESVGVIRELAHHTRWPLVVNGHLIGHYEDDANYYETDTGEFVCEDVKGMKTPSYLMKKKLMKAIHRVNIQEVRNGGRRR